MKARVIKHLNIRTREPRVLADNNPGFFSPNDTIEVMEAVDGDLHKGSRVWYKLDDGSFVWSGGVQRTDELVRLAEVVTSMPFQPVNLPSKIRFRNQAPLRSRGAGGVVAVLDSGISNDLFTPRIVLSRDFVDTSPGPHEFHQHGTQVAGLLCGSGPQVTGMASQCSIVDFRVADLGGNALSDPVFNALEALTTLQQPIDVVNMSIEITARLVPRVQPFINTLVQKGIVVVVAAGNGTTINEISGLTDTIHVGAIPVNDFPAIKQQGLNKVYDCAFIDKSIHSTALHNTFELFGQVSAYTAVVSGCLCAFLREPGNRQLQGRARLEAARTLLSNAAFSFSQELSPNPFKLLKP